MGKPIKNDFIKTCEKYLDILDIKLSLKEIENMSVWKSKTKAAGLKYLLGQKERQSKTVQIKYEYLVDGHCKKSLSQLIFQERSQTLDIKMQQKWKQAGAELCQAQVKQGHLAYHLSLTSPRLVWYLVQSKENSG